VGEGGVLSSFLLAGVPVVLCGWYGMCPCRAAARYYIMFVLVGVQDIIQGSHTHFVMVGSIG